MSEALDVLIKLVVLLFGILGIVWLCVAFRWARRFLGGLVGSVLVISVVGIGAYFWYAEREADRVQAAAAREAQEAAQWPRHYRTKAGVTTMHRLPGGAGCRLELPDGTFIDQPPPCEAVPMWIFNKYLSERAR